MNRSLSMFAFNVNLRPSAQAVVKQVAEAMEDREDLAEELEEARDRAEEAETRAAAAEAAAGRAKDEAGGALTPQSSSFPFLAA